MVNPARRDTREIDRHSTGALVPMRGPLERRPASSGHGADIEVLFAVITDYGDDSPLEAATAMWSAAQAQHPGAVVHVIHPRDVDMVVMPDGRRFWRGIELETIQLALR